MGKNAGWIGLVLSFATLAGVGPRPLEAQVSHLTLTAADGLELYATLYSSSEPGPGVLLHHMCGDWRADYHPLARALMAQGVTVLTYDLRSQGQTQGPSPFEGGRTTPEVLQEFFMSDARLAFDYLVDRPSVDAGSVLVGGSSCGTFPTVGLALERDVPGILLLSGVPPTLDSLLSVRPAVRLFGVTARDDRSDQLSAYQALRERGREGDEIHIFDTGGHGTRNLTAHPELLDAISRWVLDVARSR